MTQRADWLTLNSLHPKSVYIDQRALQGFDPACLAGFSLPTRIDRVRVIVEKPIDNCPDLRGWKLVKTTLIRRVATGGRRPLGYTFEHPASEQDWKNWYRAQWQHYRTSHRDNPPVLGGKSPSQVFDEGVSAENAVFILDRGRRAGVTSVLVNQGGHLELGHTFGENRQTLSGLLCWAMLRAHEIGYGALELEADTTDAPLWDAVQNIPAIGPDMIFTTFELSR